MLPFCRYVLVLQLHVSCPKSTFHLTNLSRNDFHDAESLKLIAENFQLKGDWAAFKLIITHLDACLRMREPSFQILKEPAEVEEASSLHEQEGKTQSGYEEIATIPSLCIEFTQVCMCGRDVTVMMDSFFESRFRNYQQWCPIDRLFRDLCIYCVLIKVIVQKWRGKGGIDLGGLCHYISKTKEKQEAASKPFRQR